MEGALFGGQLSARRAGRVRFELAAKCDDAEIRRLLRDNPMAGPVALSLEREPSFFADGDLLGEEKQTIVAREGGRLVCVGTSTTRLRFVNGVPRRVSYLGGLRLDQSVAGRFEILRGGYDFFRQLQADAPADFYFTSIAAGNERARRFLERGLPGMPRYEFAGEFVTLILPVPRRVETPHANRHASSLDEICQFLNERGHHYQFAPCWSAGDLAALQPFGLSKDDFQVVRSGGQIVACAGLWDQRAFKQTVVRGYAPWLSRLRPIINIAARVTRRSGWPAPGTTLAHAFASHLAVADDEPKAFMAVIRGLLSAARQRKIEMLTLGVATNDPRLAAVRAYFPCREYRSRIYVVHWPEALGSALDLDESCLAPEAALL